MGDASNEEGVAEMVWDKEGNAEIEWDDKGF